jgi:DNA topoisomerase I
VRYPTDGKASSGQYRFMDDSRESAPRAAAADPTSEAAALAHANGLRYVSDADPGIRRLRKGKRFAYAGPDDRAVTDAATLARIARLAIPPAYEDVWICMNDRGHLQATGRDARQRKQYRYHQDWRLIRDSVKFQRMTEFGDALPRLRRRVRLDLSRKGLPREKVLAAIVGLLDRTWIRVGNSQYARDNGSYGLTTLRNRHVRFTRPGRLLFQFRAKGGVEHEVVVDDARLVRIVRRCHELPGQRLFQYVDDGSHHPIDSDQVNEYLREATGADFTAKDFRTWGATMRAITIMARTPLPESRAESALNACVVAAVKEVATQLRNTPAVCRKSYINPVVFDGWRSGGLHKAIPNGRSSERKGLAFLNAMGLCPTTEPDVARHRSVDRKATVQSCADSRKATGDQRNQPGSQLGRS